MLLGFGSFPFAAPLPSEGLGEALKRQAIRATRFNAWEDDVPFSVSGGRDSAFQSFEHYTNLVVGIGHTVQDNAVATLEHHPVAIHRRGLQTTIVARDGRADGTRKNSGSFGIGMQGIGKEFGVVVERRVQVDEPDVGSCSNLANGLLNGLVPVARTALETWMAMEDGRHQANPNPCLRIRHAERVDERTIIADELIAVVRPVARVGIVQSQMNDDEVGFEVHSLPELRQLRIRPVAVTEQGGSRVAKVSDVEALAQQLLKHNGIGGVLTVAQAVAIGDAIAHAGHA